MIRRLLSFTFVGISSIVLAQDNVVPFTSSNLPIIVINTFTQPIPDDPKITVDMGIIYNGLGIQNNVSDPFNEYNGQMGIEIRGSSSQIFPKKQYSIELRDGAGKDLEVSLLGMPPDEDWVLFAPYNDKSLMRDVLAYKLGRDLGRYAPRTKYCELVLNGNHQGVYVVIEKIKRDKNRVNINKLDPNEISGENLTGGYIIKLDKTTGGGDGWVSDYQPQPHPRAQEIFFQYEVPEYDEMAAEQKQYIQNFIKQFETSLASENYKDPVDGYAKYIDVNSFIDYFLMQEITKNVDGYRLSAFFYKQKDADGGKLFMGPIWDFNLGFGNADYCQGGTHTGFAFLFNAICDQDDWLIPFWWHRLLEDDNFKTKVTERWAEMRASKWQQSTIHNYIDSVTTVLNIGAQQRNFQAWPVLNQYVWPNFYIGLTFGSEVNYLKGWITQRLLWLDANLPQIITATEKELISENGVKSYPNPFSSQVTFEYTLQKAGPVNLRVFDGVGGLVRLINMEHSQPGTFTYTLQADVTAGLYYYNLQQGSTILGKGKLNKGM